MELLSELRRRLIWHRTIACRQLLLRSRLIVGRLFTLSAKQRTSEHYCIGPSVDAVYGAVEVHTEQLRVYFG